MTTNLAVFLSYASQDADAARRICEALRATGFEVWFDQSELRGGDAWDQSIRKQIKECALFIPVISANTDARPEGYFRLEWKLAVDRSHLMADDQPFFVPVILGDTPEPTARVPEKFRERQWTRLKDDASMPAFAERVGKLLGGSGSLAQNGLTSSPGGEFAHQNNNPQTRRPREGGDPASSDGESKTLDPGPLPPERVVRRDDTVKPGKGMRAAQPANGAKPTGNSRPRLIAIAAILFALGSAATAWIVIERQRNTAFIAQSLSKIDTLTRGTKYIEAFKIAQAVERAGGAELLTDEIRNGFSHPVNVESKPPGANIAIRAIGAVGEDTPWLEVGNAPLQKLRVPIGMLEWRATLAGHEPERKVRSTLTDKQISFALWPPGAAEASMVPVSGGVFASVSISGLETAPRVPLEPYLIDREELTNREYAKFVQAGGYTREEFWNEPFHDASQAGSKTLGFKEAMARFKDATGRTGPATWKLGSYPNGEADLPVRGISWYEAAAYAAFAGKELPTIYHWYFADNNSDAFVMPGVLLPAANFENATIRSAASTRTVSAFGAVNMAGNVREWVSNPTDRLQRIAVGGSFLEMAYQYQAVYPRSAFDRAPDLGVRYMKRTAPPATSAADPAFAALAEKPPPDPNKIKPVSDAEFAIYTRFFEQRPVPLDIKVESVDDSSPIWSRSKVSYAAGYGNERMNAFLYFPKNAKPPYQTIIYMPGSNAFGNFRPYAKEVDAPGWIFADQLVRGGRAVLVPIWKGSFERSFEAVPGLSLVRELYGQHVSELRQSIAFLTTRAELDPDRIGYYGLSSGASRGVVLLAMEPRLKVGILVVGGLWLARRNGDLLPPELSNATYAPRVKSAVLMLNGRDDAINPYESSQVPLFKLFGSPSGKKKHKTYPGAHFAYGWYDDMVRDTHDWLDEHFGPVTPMGQR